jgi:branched-chain amino acid transport system substrate-binding protein
MVRSMNSEPFSPPQTAGSLFWSRLLGLAILLCLNIHVFRSTACCAQATPIRIGATVSLTGKYSQPSSMMRDSFKLWEKQVNERGGLLGRRVEFLFRDDQSCEQMVGTLYEKLITEDKVDLVLPPYGTPLTLVASEVSELHGFVMLACAASGDAIWNRGYKRVFGIYGPAKRYFIGLLHIMASNGLSSLALLFENSSFSVDMAAGSREWAERLGLKVSVYKSYASGEEELPGLAKEVMEAKPDGLIVACYPEDTYLLLDLMKKWNYRPKVMGFSVAAALPDFYLRAGAIAEGVFGASQWEPDERMPFPGTKKFTSDFRNFTGRLPSYHAGSAYAGCQILEKAINHCRCLDQAKIAEYIGSLDTVTVIGRFRVDHDGRQIGHNSITIQWQEGEKEIVFPLNMQTMPPRLYDGSQK